MIIYSPNRNMNDKLNNLSYPGEDDQSFTDKEYDNEMDYENSNYFDNQIQGRCNDLNRVFEVPVNFITEQRTEEETRPPKNNVFYTKNEVNNKSDEIKKNKKEGKKRGRKKNCPEEIDEERKHNKYSDDNIRRKCKFLVINNLQNFINNQIICKVPSSPKLLTLNQSQIFNATIEFNKNFLNKKLEDIFSEKISSRYSTIDPYHNKVVINDLINAGNEDNKNYFRNLFNLSFLQCLKHFRKSEVIVELKGLKLFQDIIEDIKKKNNGDDDYVNVLFKYIMHFESFINKKKPRLKSDKEK